MLSVINGVAVSQHVTSSQVLQAIDVMVVSGEPSAPIEHETVRMSGLNFLLYLEMFEQFHDPARERCKLIDWLLDFPLTKLVAALIECGAEAPIRMMLALAAETLFNCDERQSNSAWRD